MKPFLHGLLLGAASAALGLLAYGIHLATPPAVALLRAALQTWDSYGVAADRRWLQPLLDDILSAGPPV